jgi:diguanylate cyclase (GGDEF)-like protein
LGEHRLCKAGVRGSSPLVSILWGGCFLWMCSLQKLVPRLDHVTGLSSRGDLELLFSRRLPAASGKAAETIAVLICDVVGLKSMNDAEGFHAGDAMLAAAAVRLKTAAADAEMLARLGGDEFVAVYGGGDAEKRAAIAANRLQSPPQDPAESEPKSPPLRAAWAVAEPGENSAEFIDRLYARMRAS